MQCEQESTHLEKSTLMAAWLAVFYIIMTPAAS